MVGWKLGLFGIIGLWVQRRGSEKLEVRREKRGRRWFAGGEPGFIELGLIVIIVFGLIIVIFISISMFDKHYTRVIVKSQVNSFKFSNVFFGRIDRI